VVTLFIVAICRVWAQDELSSDARSLLTECFAAQARFECVSVRGVTRTGSPTSSARELSFWLRRNHDLLDISAEIRGIRPDDSYIRKLRFVGTKQFAMRYYFDPNQHRPRSGIARKATKDGERKRWLEMPGYSAALDGCLPGTDATYTAQLLLDADDLSERSEEAVGGVACRVVSGSTPYGRISLWIGPTKNCIPLKTVIEKKADDLFAGGHTLQEADLFDPAKYPGQSAARQLTILDEVTVSETGGALAPVSGCLTIITNLTGGDKFTTSRTFRRAEVDYAPRFRDTDAFVIDLPNGSLVNYVDERDHGVQYQWRDGKVEPAFTHFTSGAEGARRAALGRRQVVLMALGAATLLAIGVWLFLRRV